MANPLSGFLGFGGKANNDYRDLLSTVGSQKDTANQARNVFDIGLPSSIAKTDEGMGDLTQSSDWWRKILTGDTDAMAAASPAFSAINDQAAARRMGQAQFGTARGGGVNALNQQQESARLAEINKIIAGVRPEAAQQLATIGNQKAQLGLQQMSQALTALGLDATTAANVANQLLRAREQSAGEDKDKQRQMGNILGALWKMPGVKELVGKIPGVGEFLGITPQTTVPSAGTPPPLGSPGAGPANSRIAAPPSTQTPPSASVDPNVRDVYTDLFDENGLPRSVTSQAAGPATAVGLGITPSLVPAAAEFGASTVAPSLGAPTLRTAAEYAASRATPVAANAGGGAGSALGQGVGVALKYAPIVGQLYQVYSAMKQAGVFSGSGHKAANIVTQQGGLQDALTQTLNQVQEISRTDPAGARQLMQQVWPEFLKAANEMTMIRNIPSVSKDKDGKPVYGAPAFQNATKPQEHLYKAVKQMLTETPALMNVVRDALGGADPLAGVTFNDKTGMTFSGGQPTPLKS